MRYLSRTKIQTYQPDPLPPADGTALVKAQNARQAAGCGSIQQQMGSRWPIGCVALEITQRCNLDCTLCYLSEYMERTRDLPLSVMFNTTVHRGNFHKIPALVKFFKRHAGKVRTASFQLQADTGRGIKIPFAKLCLGG